MSVCLFAAMHLARLSWELKAASRITNATHSTPIHPLFTRAVLAFIKKLPANPFHQISSYYEHVTYKMHAYQLPRTALAATSIIISYNFNHLLCRHHQAQRGSAGKIPAPLNHTMRLLLFLLPTSICT